LDRHQWDAYFALFARDVYVPWKAATVRLDTYSGAPVDFAAYNVDPAEVIVAGANRAARPLDTSRLRPLVRWRYSPPPGYRFESNDVGVPLRDQEGFYVVEARRGDAVQQVWLNRTHVGLLSQESPGGLVLWGVDLRSGKALANMNVAFLVGLRLISKRTDARGVIVWPQDAGRPAFALAESGPGRAFVSFLPQAPLPEGIVGLRLDSAVARAGETIRFVGFARRRSGGSLRRASGDVRVTLAGRGAVIASVSVRLDAAGAFSGALAVPPGTDAGQFALLATAAGAVGGTSVQIDAASDVALAIRSGCPCDPDRDVPFTVTARRDTLPAADVGIRLTIVRTPHVLAPGASEDTSRWGTTVVYDRTVRTDAAGEMRLAIPSPTDGLDSTYGIRAVTRGATATSRIVVPNAAVALSIEAAAARADVGAPVAFTVRGFDPADGSPAAKAVVNVRLSHGASEHSQSVTLDDAGAAHVVFAETSLGSNLALAETTVAGRQALDATAVLVEPSALAGQTASAESDVAVTLERKRYRPGDRIAVTADAPGASGQAFLALEGARTYAFTTATVDRGSAAATFDLGGIAAPQGALRVSASFVRDGAIASGAADVALDAPGHPRLTSLALDKQAYEPGGVAHLTIKDGGSPSSGSSPNGGAPNSGRTPSSTGSPNGGSSARAESPLRDGATLAIRVADGRASGPALFDDAPDVLASGATSDQAPASADPQWHAYVAPASSKANDIFAAERPRKAATEVPSIGVAAPRILLWQVARAAGDSLDFTVPNEPGHFVVSVMKIFDDGDVGAASLGFTVQ
jgi:hypothetical protein